MNEINVILELIKKRVLIINIDIEFKKKYMSMVCSFNKEQRDIYQYIFSWCRKMLLVFLKEEEFNLFQIFLSGGVGVGKSYCIYIIY